MTWELCVGQNPRTSIKITWSYNEIWVQPLESRVWLWRWWTFSAVWFTGGPRRRVGSEVTWHSHAVPVLPDVKSARLWQIWLFKEKILTWFCMEQDRSSAFCCSTVSYATFLGLSSVYSILPQFMHLRTMMILRLSQTVWGWGWWWYLLTLSFHDLKWKQLFKMG